jgi:Protein of unknown function (DUF1571)
MRVRTARLGQGWNSLRHGWSRSIFVAWVAALAALAHAGEDREPSSASVKAGSLKAQAAAASGRRESRPDALAAADNVPSTHRVLKPNAPASLSRASAATTAMTPIDRALRAIALCQARYEEVEDYTCTFYKRERIASKMTPLHVMDMKVRAKPQSVYLKFQQPARGREAIYIAGRHGGRVLAHDVGLNKLVAGTLQLEPTSARAMEDCRHPITEAGIGPLLETLAKRWALELNPMESKLVFHDDVMVGQQHCTMIESIHPHVRRHFLHHKVRVYIDQELGLPIRFEAYDWPKHPGSEPDLTEEYNYANLKLNVGLRDIDFDVSNSAYSFGRF